MDSNNTPESLYKKGARFKMTPDALHNIGQRIIDESVGFGQCVKKIYENVDEMARNNYQSAESIELANKIKSYQQNLIYLTQIIENYGIHCQKSAKMMIETQNSIESGIR